MLARFRAAQGTGCSVRPGALGSDHLDTRWRRPPSRADVRHRAALVLLRLDGARTAPRRRTDQPGSGSLLFPHWAVRPARQQRALHHHSHQSCHGVRVTAPRASRSPGRHCRAPLGFVSFSRLCASLRGVSRDPDRGPVSGESAGHVRGRSASRSWRPIARQSGSGSARVLHARRHVLQPQCHLCRPAPPHLHLLGA
jgi:hypothetical protein